MVHHSAVCISGADLGIFKGGGCKTLFKGNVNPEIVKNIARCIFLIITVMYIKVYIS